MPTASPHNWPSALTEWDKGSLGAEIGSGFRASAVMLGSPITRPELESEFQFSGTMDLEIEERDVMLDFFHKAQGYDTFDFPHPFLGEVKARFADDPRSFQIRHKVGRRYSMYVELEIVP